MKVIVLKTSVTNFWHSSERVKVTSESLARSSRPMLITIKSKIVSFQGTSIYFHRQRHSTKPFIIQTIDIYNSNTWLCGHSFFIVYELYDIKTCPKVDVSKLRSIVNIVIRAVNLYGIHILDILSKLFLEVGNLTFCIIKRLYCCGVEDDFILVYTTLSTLRPFKVEITWKQL